MSAAAKPPHPLPKPAWLKRRLPTGETFNQVRELIDGGRLHTVCQEAKCPNIWECFSHRTATFLIMGGRCTRNCRFCNVENGRPEPLDPDEPARVAEAAARMNLRYVVVTSVTRDDLADGGAAHFAAVIAAIRGRIPEAEIEVLIPDFQGDPAALQTVLQARPDVLNHNVETVPRLYPLVRPQADYRRSLELLRRAGPVGEQPGRFDDVIRLDFLPGQLSRIFDGHTTNVLAIDDHAFRITTDLGRRASVDRVILEQIGEIVRRNDIVDSDELDVLVLHRRPKHQPADTPETIDRYTNRHCHFSCC